MCDRCRSFAFCRTGKLIQTNSGAREHLFYEAPSGSRKTISASDVERLQWSTFTCVLGPTVKGVFPPGSDITDVNATCRTKDKSLLASGDDFGFVNLFEYPLLVSGVLRMTSSCAVLIICLLSLVVAPNQVYRLKILKNVSPCHGNPPSQIKEKKIQGCILTLMKMIIIYNKLNYS